MIEEKAACSSRGYSLINLHSMGMARRSPNCGGWRNSGFLCAGRGPPRQLGLSGSARSPCIYLGRGILHKGGSSLPLCAWDTCLDGRKDRAAQPVCSTVPWAAAQHCSFLRLPSAFKFLGQPCFNTNQGSSGSDWRTGHFRCQVIKSANSKSLLWSPHHLFLPLSQGHLCTFRPEFKCY